MFSNPQCRSAARRAIPTGKTGKTRRTEMGFKAMIARFANHRLVLEVVKARRGLKISKTTTKTKMPKKNPSRIFASWFITFDR